jgi:hypothetical protein
MEATPLAQVVVVALATNCTGEVTVALFVGLVTATVANAGDTNVMNTRRREGEYFMMPPLECVLTCVSRVVPERLNCLSQSGSCAGLRGWKYDAVPD